MNVLGKIIFYSMIVLIIICIAIIILFFALAFSASSSAVLSSNTKPVGNLGEDVLLSCYLNTETTQTLSQVTVTWEKKDLTGLVYLYENKAPNLNDQAQEFKGRTQLFSEAVTIGNASLLLRNVRRGDEGEYTCSISSSSGRGKVNIHLRTAAFSAPTFTFPNNTLVAEASRWFPKPNVTWTNRTGNELEGITQFTEGSDGIFSVISKLPVNVRDTYNCKIANNLVTANAEATVTGTGVLGKTFFTFSFASSLLASVYLNIVTCVVCIYYMT